jgi:hypothetical protein
VSHTVNNRGLDRWCLRWERPAAGYSFINEGGRAIRHTHADRHGHRQAVAHRYCDADPYTRSHRQRNTIAYGCRSTDANAQADSDAVADSIAHAHGLAFTNASQPPGSRHFLRWDQL